jgi:hypothetical protein
VIREQRTKEKVKDRVEEKREGKGEDSRAGGKVRESCVVCACVSQCVRIKNQVVYVTG